ncbi:Putative E3 ubiquitin-protein ligase UNKL [Geodia barretti]|uniref:E3 ubiquitin-protein ligase UNKL n=1 Tax=Geodia barretti TaxID=519541 RepID=A0AA35VSL0_GEOBA|nr:Putative E3 ubiquitin-protein ligase UNKL [Geodia barretti]
MWAPDMNARERRLSERMPEVTGFPPRACSAASGGSTTPASEKPFHYSYLKEFRVEQCKAFLQHKCNQHRPFTCFNWHFMNQRRRRPVKRRDGTFNYSPDVYCTLYDENTGVCPNSDDCPYLHRTAGDTERRYHLRYYKTSTCVYETDVRGYCVKNGPHCAFAHGPHDLRSPVYDIRELAGVEDEVGSMVSSLEREKGVLVDDLRWQESSFVLTYYIRKQMQLIDADTSLDESEKQRRKQVELQTSLSLSYTAITPPPISCVSV